MDLEHLDMAVKIAACVCGKDGFISETEEREIFNIIFQSYPTYSLQRFNKAIDEYFEGSYQLEDYLNFVSEENLKFFTVQLCKLSASSDGLDIRENIALHKVAIILGVEL